MTVTAPGPCEVWTTTDEIFACHEDDEANFDSARIDLMATVASNILYRLSAKQFSGVCEATVRPCNSSRPVFRTITGQSWVGNGTFSHGCGCRSADRCSCSRIEEIELGLTPVLDVTEVIVDGVALDPSDYRVDGWRYLVRLDGEAWPCCADLTSDPPDFEVTFDYGREIPPEGRLAASVLAYELLLSCKSSTPADAKKCRLPRNLQSIARQGISMTFDPGSLLTTESGKPIRFGISEIDMFLLAWVPYGQRTSAVVMSPDIPPAGRRVGT